MRIKKTVEKYRVMHRLVVSTHALALALPHTHITSFGVGAGVYGLPFARLLDSIYSIQTLSVTCTMALPMQHKSRSKLCHFPFVV